MVNEEKIFGLLEKIQLDRLENKVDVISVKVGSHDVQIKLLKK